MRELVKSNETENKPTNAENNEYKKYTKEEICSICM